MAEYLSPGVYVEEYDNSPRGMEGVGTSTAGFVGLAERGATVGAPVLITNYSEYTRKYGGYLSEFAFGEYRYLAGAVEQFFQNGGTRCYVSRVIPADAKAAAFKNEVLSVEAANEGSWGNRIELHFSESTKKKMQLLEKKEERVYLAKSTVGFEEGSLVKAGDEYNRISRIFGKEVTFEKAFQQDVTDKKLVPDKLVFLSELEILVKHNEEAEVFTELSLHETSGNYINLKMKDSELVKLKFNPSKTGNADASADKVTAPAAGLSSEQEEAPESDSLDGESTSDYEAELESQKTTADAMPAESPAAGQQSAGGIGNPIVTLLGEGISSIVLKDGEDGTMAQVSAGTFIGEDLGPGKRTGIQAFLENHIVSIMAVPGITMPDVIVSLIAHCENTQSRFAVLDMPKDIADTKKLIEYRGLVDSTYAAMYHPWIQAFDRSNMKPGYFPPSGAVMGVYSRTDIQRGVHKAPANETVSCTGLNINFTKGEQDILNPEGVNLIRALPGQGIRIWGARTASSNASFKYVNIRRLFIYVEESIKANTNWVVFEPNDANLWSRVRISVDGFLNTMFRDGMFSGASPEESYFVEIGPTTMTADDIKNGRLICNIGIAPSRPAEFVIFRITQHTSESGS